MRTSIVERLCAPLCEALLDPPARPGEVQAALDRLLRANLFTVAVEETSDGPEWSRYHPLFRALLEQRLAREVGAAGVEALHRRAADWFAGHDLIDEAIDHLLKAGDPDQAARLVEARTPAALDREDWGTLWRWLRRLPEELTRRRPGLLLAHAFVDQCRGRRASMAARLRAATALLDAADPALPPAEAATLSAQAALLEGTICGWRGDGDGAVAAARRALAAFPDGQGYLGGSALFELGVGLHLLGQKDEALRALGDADDAARPPASAPRARCSR